ncbi:hypothetical protein [Turneriella parva]|uniref:Uncharacterized protein n=1 Tax=Turneriella parva (strain ATCC BAA-1111 / DSM 21527 / NCTC 11395 / H) TaxID=869212 RepID=I4B4X0_TURPD|nr:hypothetical protein [Turneriella parva]AFM12327.1 hypothetical protein Turpa_1679 [Turneriella parva DSM 21527]
MVKILMALCAIGLVLPLGAEITITSSTVNLSGANAQLVSKLDSTLDELFYGIASLAGPGIVNAAAFSSTIGVQRQQAEVPRFQLEPSVGLIVPSKGKGDERLSSFPLYAVNVVGGFRIDEKTAMQLRAFYLPEMSFNVRATRLSIQPYNLGATLTRQVKAPGTEWYNPGIITPLDLAYMHGSLAAAFSGTAKDISFDPTGDGSQGTAKADFTYTDDFRLNWNVYSFTSGLIFVKPFLSVFTARLGVLASLHLGNSSLTNKANGTMLVTASAASGANEFKVNDTANIEVRNAANFRPVLISNQLSLGLGINLGGATLNLDLTQNLQVNATAIIVQFGCWL